MAGLGGMNFKMAKMQFFDRPITKGIDRAAKNVLSKFGAFVRRTAKSSLKRAKMKSLSEMTPEERDRYTLRKAIAKRKGEKPPRRPEVISKPGEPPKLHYKPRSPLRELIFFVYDPKDKAVLIGPTASRQTNGEATEALEYGGASISKVRGRTRRLTVAARPTMHPAHKKNLPKLREWRNTIK